MSVPRVIARNLASSWAGYVVQVIVTFYLTPYVLGGLGEARYGLWTILTGLTGYYGLLDLGFRGGITQYLTRYLATRDFARLNETASTSVAVLAGFGGVVLLGSVGVAAALPALFTLSDELRSEAVMCTLIIGAGAAAQFLFFTFSSVFAATQRYDIANAIGVGTRVLSAVAVVTALRLNLGLAGVAVATTLVNLIDYGIRWRLSYYVLPELSISRRLVRRSRFFEVATFGSWNTAIALSGRIIAYSNSLIIGAFVSVAAVAPYAVALSLVQYYLQVFGMVGLVLFPVAAAYDATGDRSALRSVYLVGTRVTLVLAAIVAPIAAFGVDTFFRLWLKEKYPTSGDYSPALLFNVLLVGYTFMIGRGVSSAILLGQRRLRAMAGVAGAEAAANVVLSLILVHYYGVLGVAIGTAAPAIINAFFVQPAVVRGPLGVSFSRFYREVWIPPAAVAVAATGVVLLTRTLLPGETWPSFITRLSVQILLAGIAALWIGLTPAERRRFVWQPAGRAATMVTRLRSSS